MTKSRRGDITVLLLDDAHAAPRRVRVSRGALAAVAVAAVVVGGGVLALVVHYALIAPSVLEARGLRAENTALEAEAAALASRIDRVRDDEEDLRGLQKRLMELSGVDETDLTLSHLGRAGVGGAPAGSSEPFAFPLDELSSVSVPVDARLDVISSDVRRERGALNELLEYFRGRETLLRRTPSIAPTRGYLTSGFGTREDPFTTTDSSHSGDDIAAPTGTDVVAPADGTVILAGENGGYGNCVMLEHRPGLTTVFGHMQNILVRAGDKVIRGQRIGHVGSTGRSTGPHLHYEVRFHGVPVNPRRFIIR